MLAFKQFGIFLVFISLLLTSLPAFGADEPSEPANPTPEPADVTTADMTVNMATDGCSFRSNPDEFLNAAARVREDVFQNVRKFRTPSAALASRESDSAATVVRRNFIDDDIFPAILSAGVQPAEPASDGEFLRRIYFDLTGRMPAPATVRQFLQSASPTKRDELIETLLASPEFSDKWAVWFADLIQNTERLSTNQRAPQIEGRNNLDAYVRDAVARNKPVSQIVSELITGSGNNFLVENGTASYPVLASTAMGPAQDTYDSMLSRTASQFLGMAHYDCVLCHNGRGHLTNISLWGERALRSNAERMAAHFSRMRLNNGAPAGAVTYAHPLINSTDVVDAAAGGYDLNTTSGNRPVRSAVGTERQFTPEYHDGTKPAAGTTWRQAFAAKLVVDPMFARNFANRLWKQFFGLGLVEPVDTLDPDRLDPNNPPPAPWTLQASHPVLLEQLAQEFAKGNTDLRAFIRLLVQSSAYQLSSDYNGEWKYEYLNLYARHYPRRLDAEEIHDAITTSTGVPGRYTWPKANPATFPQGTPQPQTDPVDSAFRLPDINEPRNNQPVRDFMYSFLRGNRDTAPRSQAGSILQQLNIKNDNLLLSRTKVSVSPVLKEFAQIQDNSLLVEEVFLRFLARMPSDYEREKAVAYLMKTPSRNTAVEDLAWACANKFDFLFSY